MSKAVLTYESKLDSLLDFAGQKTVEGPEWLQSLRQKGLEEFRRQGIPTTANEEFKYTPLREIADQSWEPAEPGPAVFDFNLPFVSQDSHRIVVVNGQFDRNLSDYTPETGLVIQSLYGAIQERPNLVEKVLGKVAELKDHPFAALNTALFHDGVFVYIENGKKVEKFIEIIHITSGQGMVIVPRVAVYAENGSSAKIIERFISDGEAKNLTIPVSEYILEPESCIETIRVQDEAESGYSIALWDIIQHEKSQYLACNAALGARIGRLDQNIEILGEYAVTRLDGVAVATGEQIIDNHTKLDHAVPNCTSFEVYKQIIDDSASVVFNGKIYVHQDAQKTDAKQTNQALLLSPDAAINSKPQLEIFADDVKCTHGATVGQIEEQPLFYLMSRGIPKEQARSILVYAFAAEVFELITIEGLREQLDERLFEKLKLKES